MGLEQPYMMMVLPMMVTGRMTKGRVMERIYGVTATNSQAASLTTRFPAKERYFSKMGANSGENGTMAREAVQTAT